MGSTLAPKPASDRKHAVSLMRLRQAQCRFIISAPEQKPMFCGEATNGGSCARGTDPLSTSMSNQSLPKHEVPGKVRRRFQTPQTAAAPMKVRQGATSANSCSSTATTRLI